MTERNPDIEIYIKRASIDAVLTWVALHFEVNSQKQSGETLKLGLLYEGDPLACNIVPDVVKGGYLSVCFEPNRTPWIDDEACAVSAFDHFKLEIRCSTGGWTTGTEDTEEIADTAGWYRFTAAGRSVVNWLA